MLLSKILGSKITKQNKSNNQLLTKCALIFLSPEASAAYGDPVLHIMNRDGLLTIAGRAPQPGEDAPYVLLNHPEFVKDLLQLEQNRALTNKKAPARFLIKANVVLPMGDHNITFVDALALLTAHYDNIVTARKPTHSDKPEFHIVNYGKDISGAYDGTYQFLLARGINP